MDLESQLRLEQDEMPAGEFLSSAGGALHRRDTDPPGLYWAVIRPARSERCFIARIGWSVYPYRPPSLLFATVIGGSTTDPAGWPAAPGYRAPNDVCKPFTAEGQALHTEWVQGPHAWRSSGNPFLHVLENVQGDIDRAEGRRAA